PDDVQDEAGHVAELIRTATVGLSLQLLIPGQLAFLSRHFDVLAVGSGKDVMAAVGRREGVRVEAVEMRRRPSPLADLASLWRLYQLFRREKPLIVHSMTPKAGLLSMLAARLAGVPCRIHTFTGLVFPSRRGVARGLLLRADRLICRLATCVIPEGAGVARDLARFGVTGAMPQVVGPGNVNGIDSEYFDPAVWGPERVMAHRREVLTDPEAFVFIFVGRLVRDKGMAELAEAFVAMPFLVITLEGAFRSLDGRFEEAAATLGASAWVSFRRITMPLVGPSVVAGAVLCWARALGEFGATITFAGNFPSTTQTMPLAVYTALESDRSAAIALSIVLLIVCVSVLVALRGRYLRPTVT
ncbi:MAG: glycosyltransferase, partial [Actinomycetes bacterium]